MKKLLPKLIVILGPTASGKTEFAVKLAKKFNGEIINADSRQIYIGMDIGTAKPYKIKNDSVKSKNILIYKNIPHYLIDIITPNETFTLSQYQELAKKSIEDIINRNKTPFLVGGTGLYIQSIVDNLKIPEVPPNEKIRWQLEKLNNKQLLNKLKKLDPKTFQVIDKNNKRRIIRALEVCLVTGKPFSKLKRKGKQIFNTLQIGIDVPRNVLYRRIDKRVEKMIARELVKEVKKLNKKYPFKLPAMSGIGYKEFESYFNKKISLKQTIDLIKKNTRGYAKRQMTWFKKDKRIQWIKDIKDLEKGIKSFVTNTK